MKKLLKGLIFLSLIGTSIALLFIGNGYNMYKNAINNIPLEEKVEEIRAKENYAEFSELPQTYVNAVISVEDKRFYKHNGIDIIAIGRALINDIKAMSYVEGGSTITQQLAKKYVFYTRLAGIPNAPSVYAPTKNLELAKQRQKQVIEKMLSHIRYDMPSIVVGDFNLLPNTKSIEMISKKMINLIEKYNIKSTRPKFDDGLDKGNLVCDYIFVNDKVIVNDFKVIDTNISDHLPLILEFSI